MAISKRYRVVIAVTSIALLLAAWIALRFLNGAPHTSDTSNNGSLVYPTIDSVPYANACSVATESDFKQVFNLDSTDTGSISEHGLLPSQYQRPQLDIASLHKFDLLTPDSDSAATCTLRFGKKDQRETQSLTVKLIQHTSVVSTQFNGRMNATFAGSHPAPSQLPSLKDKGYVTVTKDDTRVNSTALAVGDRYIIEMLYSGGIAQEPAETLPLKLDTMAQKILANLTNHEVAKKQLSATGHGTQYGRPYVDVCRNVNLSTVVQAMGDIKLAEQQGGCRSVFGAPKGSLPYQDGILSTLEIHFNTPQERELLSSIDKRNKEAKERTDMQKLDYENRFLHKATISLLTFENDTDALAQYDYAIKTAGTQAVPIPDLGEAAIRWHRETENGKLNTQCFIKKGTSIIKLNVEQSTKNPYKYGDTSPVNINAQACKATYQVVSKLIK